MKEGVPESLENRHRVVSNDFEIWIDGDSVKIKGVGSCEALSYTLEAFKVIVPAYRWTHANIELVSS